MIRLFIFLLAIQPVFSQNALQKRNLKGSVESVSLSFKIIGEDTNHDVTTLLNKCNPFVSSYNPLMIQYASNSLTEDRMELHSFERFDNNGNLSQYKIAQLENGTLIESPETFGVQLKLMPSELKNTQDYSYPNFLSNPPLSKLEEHQVTLDGKNYDLNQKFFHYWVKNNRLDSIKYADTIHIDNKVDTIHPAIIRFRYDEKGRIVSRVQVSENEQYKNPVLDKFCYFYDDKNRIYKYQSFRNNKFQEEEFYHLNSNGKLEFIEKHIHPEIENDNTYIFTCKTIYHYDANNNINQIDFYDNDFGEELLQTFFFKYEYDAKQNWTKATFFLSKNGNALANFVRKISYR